MKVVELRAEGFKRLTAIDITPGEHVVTIGGKNGAGKSSVLDAIWVALAGRGAAPPKPIKEGMEKCTLKLDLGELVITRTFTDKGEGKPYTDTVKVENADGLRYSSPNEMLKGLLGAIGFDPFEFMNLKPADKAERLLALVPLSIDIEEHAELDASDYIKRRDVNRDIEALEARISATPKEDIPAEIPKRDELVAKLGSASDFNLGIDREIRERDERQRTINSRKAKVGELDSEIGRLLERIDTIKAEIEMLNKGTAEREKELAALPPIAEPIDVHELQEQIRQAENVAAIIARQEHRTTLEQQLADKRAESKAFTDALTTREKEREAALAKAKMPIEGLGFKVDDKGKPMVTFNGLPFEKDQISTAAAIRASTAIAMAANPTLRVLQIRDGSLLDEDSMAIIAELAAENDYQIFIERVGSEGVGIIIEDGAVKGAPPVEVKAGE